MMSDTWAIYFLSKVCTYFLYLSMMQCDGKTMSLYEVCPLVLVKIIALPIRRMTGS